MVVDALGPAGGALRRAPLGDVRADAVTLFKSVGVAVQDVVTAAAVLEAAQRRGLGQLVPFGGGGGGGAVLP